MFVRPTGVGQFFQDIFSTAHEEAFQHSKMQLCLYNENLVPNENNLTFMLFMHGK